MLRRLIRGSRTRYEALTLPAPARRQRRRDRQGVPASDPGIPRVVDEGFDWLGRAQDLSASRDGGVARHFSLVSGWATSYPETTGYIVPTLLARARSEADGAAGERARRMLDWLVDIQLPDGAFQGGRIDSTPVVAVTFNSGQILLGLASGATEDDRYRQPMVKAADWLVETQDTDGCWRKHPTPFARAGEKAYETHVAWGLLEAARAVGSERYASAAKRNVDWALGKQQANGWVADCCLDDPTRPLTHTLGYFLRGVVEAYLFCRDASLLEAATRTADGLLRGIDEDGRLPGRFLPDWRPAVDWVCLTGAVQVAHSWLLLFRETGDTRYRDAAFAANAYVRRTVDVDGPPEVRGAVKGSFPVDGDYGRYQYLNWAVKFCVDANLLEQEVRSGGDS